MSCEAGARSGGRQARQPAAAWQWPRRRLGCVRLWVNFLLADRGELFVAGLAVFQILLEALSSIFLSQQLSIVGHGAIRSYTEHLLLVGGDDQSRIPDGSL